MSNSQKHEFCIISKYCGIFGVGFNIIFLVDPIDIEMKFIYLNLIKNIFVKIQVL